MIGSVVSIVGCSAPRRQPAVVGPSANAVETVVADATIDRLIESTWRAAGVRVAPVASDSEFLRRASLDLIGRIPTLAEARLFLDDPGADKRARLVDALLASPEFAEHWADVYSELLWRTDGSKKIEKQDPRSWLVTAWNENWGYDRMVHDLITATGTVNENRPAAFLAARTRKGGGPEAVAGATARLFLGLQIQCAQCHDHPYDRRWKQPDFYGLVAYFARTRVKRERGMEGESYAVTDLQRGEAKMHAPQTIDEVVIEPRFLGSVPPERPTDTRRSTLARAIIASDLFPKAMVARTWAQFFGRGLVDPWDDLGGEGDARHPPLLNQLANDFRGSGFDTKRLIRRIVLSTAYARSSAVEPGTPDDGGAAARLFARAAIRPLSPEQLFRSLVTATGVDEMGRLRQGADRSDRHLDQVLREYRFAFDDDEMAPADSFDGSLPQVLLLLNGEITNRGVRGGDEGVLGGILRSTRDPEKRLDQLFVAVYARPPTAQEKALFLPSLFAAGKGDARRGYEDLFFALLTSSESVTNH